MPTQTARSKSWSTCGSLGQTKPPSLSYFAILLVLVCLCHRSQSSVHVTDICDNGAVDTAAHLVFRDGVERYFISNGNHYWFLNVTSDIPDVQSASNIPYGFNPDVAILKNTSLCPSGYLSLLLIQMKRNADNEADWLTLEMRIGNWSDNETGPVFWSQVNKIAHCDLNAQVCTTTDLYFATMNFDFKKRLSSAFGTVGETAFFIQGQSMYKVDYKTQCIANPYTEVTAHAATDIGTTTTAALEISTPNENASIIMFDSELHLKLDNVTLSDLSIRSRLVDIGSWKENANHFFARCPLVESAFSFLLMDVFSSSKKHFFKKQVILIASAIVLLFIIVAVLAIIVFNLVKKPKKRNSVSPSNEANEEQLIEQAHNVQIKSGENGEHEKTLLQTSC